MSEPMGEPTAQQMLMELREAVERSEERLRRLEAQMDAAGIQPEVKSDRLTQADRGRMERARELARDAEERELERALGVESPAAQALRKRVDKALEREASAIARQRLANQAIERLAAEALKARDSKQ